MFIIPPTSWSRDSKRTYIQIAALEGDLLESLPKIILSNSNLDCYWVRSLDFNLLNKGVSIKPKKHISCADRPTAPKK